jgi:hypothetical protein
VSAYDENRFSYPQGMTKLESYGDSLEKDDYRCHSRFERAVNFFNGHSLVALVDRKIGPGPHHLLISGLDRQKIDQLTITADELLIEGSRYPFAASCRYDSRIDLADEVDRGRFGANLEYFSRCLRRSATPRSLAFLLEPRHKVHRRSALARSIAERLAAGSELVFSPDILTGTKMCKGLGFGLTPGGDDFNGGVLLALHCAQKIFNRDFRRAITSVYESARGGNPFSNTMLAGASKGRAIGRIKDLLAALLYGGEKDVYRCVKELRTIGHSSGIDFGTGLLLALQKLDRNEGEKWW